MNLILIPFMSEKAKKRWSAIVIEIRVGSTVCSLLFESRTQCFSCLLNVLHIHWVSYSKFLQVSKINAKNICISIGNKQKEMVADI